MFLCFSPSRVSSQSSQASIHTVVYLSSMLCPRSAQGGGMSWRLSSRILRLLLGTESLQEYQHQHPFISQLQVLQDWLSGYHHHSCVINLLWIWVYYGQLLNSKCLGTGIRGSSVSYFVFRMVRLVSFMHKSRSNFKKATETRIWLHKYIFRSFDIEIVM